jgi:hypothetical protein
MVNDRQLVGVGKSLLSAQSADNTGAGAVVFLIEGGFVVTSLKHSGRTGNSGANARSPFTGGR